MWDRKENGNDYLKDVWLPRYVKDPELDKTYNAFMINQLNELLEIAVKHTDIVEFWFDGGWAKENYRWPLNEIYQTVKSKEPDCQIGINWSIGLPEDPDHNLVRPKDLKEDYPTRYSPSDFRLGNPFLPEENDPKIYTRNGKEYYMPWKSTVCISENWFYNTNDTIFDPIDVLVDLYKVATAQDNILVLNCPPNREGKIRSKDIEILTELRERLEINL